MGTAGGLLEFSGGTFEWLSGTIAPSGTSKGSVVVDSGATFTMDSPVAATTDMGSDFTNYGTALISQPGGVQFVNGAMIYNDGQFTITESAEATAISVDALSTAYFYNESWGTLLNNGAGKTSMSMGILNEGTIDETGDQLSINGSFTPPLSTVTISLYQDSSSAITQLRNNATLLVKSGYLQNAGHLWTLGVASAYIDVTEGGMTVNGGDISLGNGAGASGGSLCILNSGITISGNTTITMNLDGNQAFQNRCDVLTADSVDLQGTVGIGGPPVFPTLSFNVINPLPPDASEVAFLMSGAPILGGFSTVTFSGGSNSVDKMTSNKTWYVTP